MSVKRITTLALYTTIALVIHVVESWVPVPVPVPGVKLGLANIVTLFMLFSPARDDNTQNDGKAPEREKTKTADVLAVLLCRIVLGTLIAGRPVMLAYSLAGGILAVTAQLLTRRIVTENQAWVCGAAGAVFHSIGQILMAIIITGTPGIAVYLPVLIIAGLITGMLTGLIAGFTAKRLKWR